MSDATPEQAANTEVADRMAAFEQWSQGAGRSDAEWRITRADAAYLFATMRDALAALKVLEDAATERDAIMRALGEPCAECGHIDWRSDGYAGNSRQQAAAWKELFDQECAARTDLEKECEVMRDALERIANGSDYTWGNIARLALEKDHEQEARKK